MGVDRVRADLKGELAAPPTLDEFIRAIEGHRRSTTPGATGLTYHMVKGWPAPTRVFAHHCLVELWDLPDTPLWLQCGGLCPKPKDQSAEVTLDGLRPLILLEVLLKLRVGIVIQRITRAWERHHVLTDAQHGFRPGRGTDTALLQFINAREHADESGTQLYTSSWDILPCLRLGVPGSHGTQLVPARGPKTSRLLARHHGHRGTNHHPLALGIDGMEQDTSIQIRGLPPPILTHPAPSTAIGAPHRAMSPARIIGWVFSTLPSMLSSSTEQPLLPRPR